LQVEFFYAHYYVFLIKYFDIFIGDFEDADEDPRADCMFPSGVMMNETTKKRVNPVEVGEDKEVVGDAGVGDAGAGRKKVSGGPSSGFAMPTIHQLQLLHEVAAQLMHCVLRTGW